MENYGNDTHDQQELESTSATAQFLQQLVRQEPLCDRVYHFVSSRIHLLENTIPTTTTTTSTM